MQSKINEIGRSMVEMLGVLAVIGILSVGGIMGYKFAMLKYRVNETVNELNIRTNEIYQYFSVQENENLPTQTVGAEIKMSLGETMRTGYPVSAFVSANNELFFELELQQVETEMCQQLMQIYKVPDVIFVNEQQYLNDLSLCGNKDFVKLNFIYNKTFNKKTACDNRSEFDSISLKCRCKGDSYLDIVSNTCKCSDGEFMGADGICYSCSDERSVAVLPQQEEACTSSACQRRVVNGYCQIQDCPSETHIRLSNGDCYSCSDERGFISTEEECDKCGNKRGYVFDHNGQIGYCRINNCVKGSSYPYNLPDNLNSCISCQKPWYTGETAYSMEYCEACGNGYYVSGNVCYGPDFCQTGSQLISNSGTECIDCTVVEKIYVGMHEKHRAYSDNCATVNRFIVEDYSYRCDTRENIPVFLGADKKSCTNCRIRSVVDDVCVLTQ